MANLNPEDVQAILKKHGLPLPSGLKEDLEALANNTRKWKPSIEMGITEPEFAAWLDELDSYTLNRIGLGILDLQDWCMRDAFDDGLSVEEAFEVMCEEQDIDPRALLDDEFGDFDY